VFDNISDFSGEQIQIRASHYDPSLGGVNCSSFVNGECISHMASGLSWQSYMNRAVACPPEYPFETKFIVAGKEWLCLDRGSAIQTVDGIPWLDFLQEKADYPYGAIVDAILVLP
jgi:hypothetical protein